MDRTDKTHSLAYKIEFFEKIAPVKLKVGDIIFVPGFTPRSGAGLKVLSLPSTNKSLRCETEDGRLICAIPPGVPLYKSYIGMKAYLVIHANSKVNEAEDEYQKAATSFLYTPGFIEAQEKYESKEDPCKKKQPTRNLNQ